MKIPNLYDMDDLSFFEGSCLIKVLRYLSILLGLIDTSYWLFDYGFFLNYLLLMV